MKAHVQNGRLVLDEPTDLPEGDVVYLQLVEGIVPLGPLDDDSAADEANAELYRELEASLAEADEGATEDFATVLGELRQRR